METGFFLSFFKAPPSPSAFVPFGLPGKTARRRFRGVVHRRGVGAWGSGDPCPEVRGSWCGAIRDSGWELYFWRGKGAFFREFWSVYGFVGSLAVLQYFLQVFTLVLWFSRWYLLFSNQLPVGRTPTTSQLTEDVLMLAATDFWGEDCPAG